MEPDYSLPPSPRQQQASASSTLAQSAIPALDILQTIAGIEARCNNPNAGPQPAVPYHEILEPLFQAIRTRLAREPPTPTPIETRLAAIEKIVLKIDRKAPPTLPTTRSTYASVAATGAPSEYRANAQRGACDPPKESARVSRQILVKILQSNEAENIKKHTNQSLMAK